MLGNRKSKIYRVLCIEHFLCIRKGRDDNISPYVPVFLQRSKWLSNWKEEQKTDDKGGSEALYVVLFFKPCVCTAFSEITQ